jgi:hypothetical protein
MHHIVRYVSVQLLLWGGIQIKAGRNQKRHIVAEQEKHDEKCV